MASHPIVTFLATPDGLALLSAIGAWIGHRFFAKKKESELARVEKWASTAAGLVVMAVRSGAVTGSTAELVERALVIFRATAASAGVTVSQEHEAKALRALHRAIEAAGRTALSTELDRLREAADGVLARMARSRDSK